jgi:hypothetical protein
MEIPNFENFVNEGKVTINKMNFSIHAFNDAKGLSVQFIPDGKTLDKFSKNEMAESIKSKLTSAMPKFADALYYSIDNQAAGLSFRVDIYELSEIITKAIK